MTSVNDIYKFIDIIAPFESAMSFDNVGILAGDGRAPVAKAVVSLDITPGVIKEAVNEGASLIISHHPVIFEPLKSLMTESVPYMLAQNGLSAICAHTNLDLAPMGVNKCLANALKLFDVRLIEGECMAIGQLKEDMTDAELALYTAETLNCTGLRYTKADKRIKSVAVSGGAGGDGVKLAYSLGADALITGEIKHHQIIEANNLGLCVVDAGHFRTEDVVIEPLLLKLIDKFPEVSFKKSSIHTDNIYYVAK